MTADWPEVRLGDVVSDITVGYVSSMTHEYRDSGIPFLRSQDIRPHRIAPVDLKFVSPEFHRRISKSALHPGDVVVVRTGAPGTAAVVPSSLPEANCSDLVVIRPGPRVVPRFLAYFFNSTVGRNHVHAHTVGAVQQHFNVGAARQARVRLPTLVEQRAIADVLGALDDKIDLNRRMNETLEAMARALFKSWFVDFDPVRAKADGRAPAGMEAATAALFPSGFEASELGEIPSGWRHAPVLDVAELISGGTPKTSVPAYWGGTIKWASAKDVSQCGAFFLLDSERTITEAGVQNSSTKILPADCVVVVARGATCGRFTVLGSPMAMNQTCYALSARAPVGPWFLRFHAEGLLQRLVAQAHGSVFDTITTSTFERARILVPPPPVLSAFEGVVTPLVERIGSGLKESVTLVTLRDALLPKLLCGEIRIRDAEKAVEQVA